MSTGTLTLADFLLARIEEERILGDDLQHWAGAGHPYVPHAGGTLLAARVNSDRILAECAAKWRIVEEHRLRVDVHERDYCDTCRGEDADGVLDEWTNAPWPCFTLRALAAAYADHPDYLEEWQ